MLHSRRLFSAGPLRWFQRRSYLNVLCTRTNVRLSLASFLGLTAFVGCSWSRLNLDSAAQDSNPPPESSLEHEKRRTCYNESYTRNGSFNVHVRDPHAYSQTFEQTIFPGDHTGIARYDTAKIDSPGCVSLVIWPGQRADRDDAHKETAQRTSRLACSPCPRAIGPYSPYSARTTPTLPTTAQCPGYEKTSSQPQPARSPTHTVQTAHRLTHTSSTTLCGTRSHALTTTRERDSPGRSMPAVPRRCSRFSTPSRACSASPTQAQAVRFWAVV